MELGSVTLTPENGFSSDEIFYHFIIYEVFTDLSDAIKRDHE